MGLFRAFLQRQGGSQSVQKLEQPRRRFLLECLAGGAAAVLGLQAKPISAARKVVVKNIRYYSNRNTYSVIFDLNAPVRHKIFTLDKPQRVVIDVSNASISQALRKPGSNSPLIKDIRYAARNNKDLRVVIDLTKKISPKSFLLPPNENLGYRLLVELHSQNKKIPEPTVSETKPPKKLRDVIIAIDAGHGGKDPGAIGRRYKTKEKDVVLAIARRLESLVKKEKGMRPVMTRNKDVFLPLRTRIKRAREQRADIFISIHADAAPNRRVRGSSVYVLSERGASSEMARVLAEQENKADLRGGILDDKEEPVARLLVDLLRNATIEASVDLAEGMLGELKQAGRIHSPKVEQAGFVVLKSLDIPSVLVETAYLSNSKDEARLRSKSHQYRIAKTLLQGIRNYLQDNAPYGTVIANLNRKTHRIRSGETLSTIAQRYDVDIKSIRRYNAIKGDQIRAGQVLRIPVSGS